ncbi:metal-dependent hydrolase [candidate division KSB1 bacterium]|nr:metal-dependent hydrolase [candidate division KSB1 bacterium]RQW01904.1 MAG: metal-dependent hydrolase [candidate division KSB1 bacterium]
MPTPIGHMLAAAILCKSQRSRDDFLFYLFILFFALLPDSDFLFGFFTGDPNRYHHLFTHSFAFVVIAGLLGGVIYAKWRDENIIFSSAIFISAGISHVILDCLAVDRREPFGCPIGWPFSQKFVISPVLLFSDVTRSSDSSLFFPSLFNMHNLQAVSIELFVLMPVLFTVWMLRKSTGYRKTAISKM